MKEACPTCGARVGEFCKTEEGMATANPHIDRERQAPPPPDHGSTAWDRHQATRS